MKYIISLPLNWSEPAIATSSKSVLKSVSLLGFEGSYPYYLNTLLLADTALNSSASRLHTYNPTCLRLTELFGDFGVRND